MPVRLTARRAAAVAAACALSFLGLFLVGRATSGADEAAPRAARASAPTPQRLGPAAELPPLRAVKRRRRARPRAAPVETPSPPPRRRERRQPENPEPPAATAEPPPAPAAAPSPPPAPRPAPKPAPKPPSPPPTFDDSG